MILLGSGQRSQGCWNSAGSGNRAGVLGPPSRGSAKCVGMDQQPKVCALDARSRQDPKSSAPAPSEEDPERGRDLSRVTASQSGAGTKLGASISSATRMLAWRPVPCASVWLPICIWISPGRRLLTSSGTHELSVGV